MRRTSRLLQSLYRGRDLNRILQVACVKGDLEVVKKVMHLQPGIYKHQCVREASRHGHCAIAQYLQQIKPV